MQGIISNFLITFAYYIKSNSKYQKYKRFFYNLLENDSYPYKKYVDFFMVFLIFSSVFVLIREVKYHVDDILLFYNNYIVSFFFFIEYILRLWVNTSASKIIIHQDEYDTLLGIDFRLGLAVKKIFKEKISYMLTPKAIVDLFAILPFFHELRMLRLFILFRVFKLFRYSKSFRVLMSVLVSKKFEFLTLGVFAFIVIFVSSVLIYIMEANNVQSKVNTLYDAVYWSIVTLTTVGFGDITPVTDEGRFVAMLIIISGIGIISFSTSLIVSAFNEKLSEFKEIKSVEEFSKQKNIYLVCGLSEIAKEVVNKLNRDKYKNIVVLDNNVENIKDIKEMNILAFNYNPGSIESYKKKLNIDFKKQIDTVLCLKDNDVENVYTALTIRSLDKDVKIISLLMNNSNRKKLEFAGVDEIIYPQELIGLITKELIGKPVAFEVIHALRSENNFVDIEEIVLTNSIVQSYPLVKDLKTKEHRLILLGVYKKDKNRFWYNPMDDTLLNAGDTLLVIGYKPFIKEFERILHKKRKS